MPLSRWSLLAAGAVVLAGSPTGADGQAYVALGASATYMSVGRADFQFPGAGFGVAGQARFGRGWLSLGVGGTMMNFPIEAQGGDFDLSGIFIEPRLTVEGLDPDGQFTPYAFARASWLSQDGAVDRVPLTGEARVIGGGAGVLLRLTPRIAIDLGGHYSVMNLTDRTFDAEPRPDEDGSSIGAHIGAYLRLGGGDEIVELESRARAMAQPSRPRP